MAIYIDIKDDFFFCGRFYCHLDIKLWAEFYLCCFNCSVLKTLYLLFLLFDFHIFLFFQINVYMWKKIQLYSYFRTIEFLWKFLKWKTRILLWLFALKTSQNVARCWIFELFNRQSDAKICNGKIEEDFCHSLIKKIIILLAINQKTSFSR